MNHFDKPSDKEVTLHYKDSQKEENNLSDFSIGREEVQKYIVLIVPEQGLSYDLKLPHHFWKSALQIGTKMG